VAERRVRGKLQVAESTSRIVLAPSVRVTGES